MDFSKTPLKVFVVMKTVKYWKRQIILKLKQDMRGSVVKVDLNVDIIYGIINVPSLRWTPVLLYELIVFCNQIGTAN